MKIDCIRLGTISENCYLISSDNAAVVIDPGEYSDTVYEFLKNNADKQRLILLTHCHYDHIGGANELREKSSVKIAIGELENSSLSDEYVNLSALFGERIKPFGADILLKDGEEFNVGNLTFKTVLTPGHTKGSVVYVVGNNIISGDTLFFESIGRTDFPGGDFRAIRDSVTKLYNDYPGFKVYPGHGEVTVTDYEKVNNPYVNQV